jgi:N-acetylglutamate synthase-like GNAT family acetyltransferase
METKIELAQTTDLQEILALLNESDLPEAGLKCSPGTLILTARNVDRTDTAEDFFARHGFQPFDRSRVPSAVAGSPGFTACRCADATCMEKRLEARRERRNPSALALSLHDLAPTDRLEPVRCV